MILAPRVVFLVLGILILLHGCTPGPVLKVVGL
jgi:hypothetical protein